MSEKQSLPPVFAGETVDLGYKTYNLIKGLSGHPNLVIREFNTDESSEQFASRRDFWDQQVSLLSQHGSIHKPKVSFIQAENQQQQAAYYAISERIVGKNLDELDQNEADSFIEVEQNYLLSLIDYYKNFITNGGEFLLDLGEKQFVYGRSKNDQEDKLYFVDLDVITKKFNPETEEGKYDLIRQVQLLFYSVRNFERLITPKKLTIVRERLKELLPFATKYPDREFTQLLSSLGLT